MCATCGCGNDSGVRISSAHEHPHEDSHDHSHEHPHPHDHEHPHSHDHDHSHPHDHPAHDYSGQVDSGDGTRLRTLELDILGKNDELAEANRRALAAREIVALNVMSSPGSGKTTLLVRTLTDLAGRVPMGVIEGDQETLLDAERVRATGVPVIQVNTGSGCHLDADMVRRALAALDQPNSSLLFVENVGNLVCPAMFDLGESATVVVISVTEGDDKPLKYPLMFAGADLLVINKVDLLPYVDFDVETCIDHVRRANPDVRTVLVSATRGDGLADWYAWLENQMARPHPIP